MGRIDFEVYEKEPPFHWIAHRRCQEIARGRARTRIGLNVALRRYKIWDYLEWEVNG
jgi:hypothetical protein